MIRRRTFTAGIAAVLAAPSIARGAASAPLKFIPQSDLTILDPIVTTVYTARNHGYMVFDTLFGMDSAYQIQPQMLDGFVVEDDGKRWKLTAARRSALARRRKSHGPRLCRLDPPMGPARRHRCATHGAHG